MNEVVLCGAGRKRLALGLAALLLSLVVATPAGAGTVDDVLAALTCTGLADGVGEGAPDLLGGLADATYCHAQSDTAVCPTAGAECATEVEETEQEGTVQVGVSGVADPGGFMALAVGRTAADEACGWPLYLPVSVRFESQGVSQIEATHRVSKSLDQQTAQNGAGNLGICYQSPKPFIDRDGALTVNGLLPDCDEESPQPPCVVKRQKNKADAILRMLLPDGDPSWQMISDEIDKATG